METSAKRFYYKQNRLKKLRAFCYAAHAQSISKAAERMFLSQPSVSLQVRALEQELGVTLFERRGPRISLTPEGHVLYGLASPLGAFFPVPHGVVCGTLLAAATAANIRALEQREPRHPAGSAAVRQ